MNPSNTPTPPRLAVIDCLRFLAALSVLAYHWFYADISAGRITTVGLSAFAPIAAYGYLGVSLFFMISGFVIFGSASTKTAASFAVGRVKRLYPAFWFSVIFNASILLILGRAQWPGAIPRDLASLTMVPKIFGQTYINGVYWTLSYELSFYVLVFILMFFGAQRWLEFFFAGWAVLMLAITVLAPHYASSYPFAGGYYGLFAAGALLASVRMRGWSLSRGIGLACCFLTVQLPYLEDSTPNLVVIVAITFFFVIMCLQTLPAVGRVRLPGSTTLGALTYPIYLLHEAFAMLVLQLFANESTKWLFYALTFAGVVGLSYFVHLIVERRLSAFWNAIFTRAVGDPIRFLNRLIPRYRESAPTDLSIAPPMKPLQLRPDGLASQEGKEGP